MNMKLLCEKSTRDGKAFRIGIIKKKIFMIKYKLFLKANNGN